MKTKLMMAMITLLCTFTLFAQSSDPTTLSLKDCVRQAVENNINVVQARQDKLKSGYKIEETRSALLPQISGSGAFQDNLKLPVTMLSGDLVGQPGTVIPLEMGVQYNTSVGMGVNQVLYNQTALTGLKLAKANDQLNTLGIEKVSENIAQEVAKLYFMAQTSAEQKGIVEKNIVRTEKVVSITKMLWDNGMGKRVDYDRINVTLENLHTQLSNTEALHEQQLNMIKYMLGISTGTTIQLTDSIDIQLLETAPTIDNDFSNHIDIQMIEKQKDIAALNQKRINNGYLPSLSFTGQVNYQGQRRDLNSYFNSSIENRWFASSYIGLNLNIPIFDGFDKRSKSRQAKVDYQKVALTLDDTKEKFSVDFKNARNNYFNYQDNVNRQEKNIQLAENVYRETALKYREGLASMSDLIQDEMGLNNAQISFLNALYNFKEAELNIMSLSGEIKKLMNK